MTDTEIRSILGWVQCRHCDFLERRLARFHADPVTVSRLATQYVHRLFYNKIVEGKIRKIAFTKAAALLVYSMECYGLNFEDVARMSDLGVAELVAAVSADPRETRARRNLALRGQLAEGGLLAQIVKFAELEATARHIYDNFTRENYRSDPVALKDWITDSEELLRAMHRLLRRKRFHKPYQRLHQYLARIDHTLERAKRRLPELPHVRLDAPALSAVQKVEGTAVPCGVPALHLPVPA